MLELEVFKANLQQVVNKSNLSAGEVYYVLKDFYNDVEKAYFQGVNKAFQEQQQKAKEEADKKKAEAEKKDDVEHVTGTVEPTAE